MLWTMGVEALRALLGRRISNERQVGVLVREGSEALAEARSGLTLATSLVEASAAEMVEAVSSRIRDDLKVSQREMVAEVVRAAVPRLQAEIARSMRAEVLGLSELFAACATLVEIGRDRTQSQWGSSVGERAEDSRGASEEGKGVRDAIESWVLQHTGRDPVGSGGA